MALDTLCIAETPEGISLSLRPAGIVPRMLACLIDLGVRTGIYLCAVLAALPFGGLGVAMTFILYFLLEWFYPVAFELMRHGATPGKQAMGLEVVMDTGLPVTLAASVIRNLLRAADFLPLLYGFGVASMLLRRDFKRLGDLAAGTLVVHNTAVGLHGQIPDAPPRAPARDLSPREQSAIVAWAGRAATLTPERLEELALLALPATTPAHRPEPDGGEATRRLLGVAQWLLGHRGKGTRP